MDLGLSQEHEIFRDEVRTWLREHAPHERRPEHEGPEMREFDMGWQRTQFDGGWAGIAWPKEYGGRGLSLTEELVWYEEYARAGAPDVGSGFVGVMHGGPTIIACGTHDQKDFHLPRILRGEAVWCQGFSEPEAGSDLAGLQTKAVVDGDELVVTGQKIWTSYGQIADYQELLVRTDPTAAKHAGISWVICDMRSPGIEVRPIETLHGTKHFCEVFYDEVRIPLTNVVGALNDGWNVARATLSFERGTAFLSEQVEFARRVEELIEYAKVTTGPDGRRPAIQDDEIARRLATTRAEAAALRSMAYASISRVARRGDVGPEGSVIRLFYSELLQRTYRLARDIAGHRGLELERYGVDGQWSWGYLNMFRYTIAAGTKDIQRNIIGERLLGLPRR